jgi:pimeloyl-ACP methyl ester carboxylesterase
LEVRIGFVLQVCETQVSAAFDVSADVGVDNSRVIADGISGAELLIVPDANHSVHIEKPDIVLGQIREFLQG